MGTSTMARRDSIVEHDVRVGPYENSVSEGIGRSIFLISGRIVYPVTGNIGESKIIDSDRCKAKEWVYLDSSTFVVLYYMI
jgi:hypothetical protein